MAICQICSVNTNTGHRTHATPKACTDAIRKALVELRKYHLARVRYLRRRLHIIKKSDRVESIHEAAR